MKKLILNKKTIARLNNPEQIYGGETVGYKETRLNLEEAREASVYDCLGYYNTVVVINGVHTEYYCGNTEECATKPNCP